MFKEVDDGRRRRTDNGACLYYKLTYEPKGSGVLGSGELKMRELLSPQYFLHYKSMGKNFGTQGQVTLN